MIRQIAATTVIAGLLLWPSTAAVAAPIDVSSDYPIFINPSDEDLGADASEGDIFDYEDVLTIGGTPIDARITVLTIEGFIGVFDAIDDQTSYPWPQLFSQLRFQEEEVGSGHVRYLFEFLDGNTGEPVTLTGLRLATRDVDETQYIQASNVESYFLSSSPATQLSVIRPSDDPSVTDGEIRFASPSVGIDPEDEDFWVALKFEDVSTFTLELGQGDYDHFEWAYYYLDFDTPTWSAPPTDSSAPPVSALPDTGLTSSALLLSAMAAGALFIVASSVFVLRSRLSFAGHRARLLSALRSSSSRN